MSKKQMAPCIASCTPVHHTPTLLLRPDFVTMRRNACQAVLLNHILYCISQKVKMAPKADAQAGKVYWYQIDADLSAQEMRGAYTVCQVRAAAKALDKAGLVKRGHNPKHPYDQTSHYSFGPEHCQAFLAACREHHLCLACMRLCKDMLMLLEVTDLENGMSTCICEEHQTQLSKMENGDGQDEESFTQIFPRYTPSFSSEKSNYTATPSRKRDRARRGDEGTRGNTPREDTGDDDEKKKEYPSPLPPVVASTPPTLPQTDEPWSAKKAREYVECYRKRVLDQTEPKYAEEIQAYEKLLLCGVSEQEFVEGLCYMRGITPDGQDRTDLDLTRDQWVMWWICNQPAEARHFLNHREKVRAQLRVRQLISSAPPSPASVLDAPHEQRCRAVTPAYRSRYERQQHDLTDPVACAAHTERTHRLKQLKGTLQSGGQHAAL